jgi:hypothetical protein
MKLSPFAPACDRASILARGAMQIMWAAPPHERLRRLAEYLRDEIAGIESQIAADRRDCDEA